MKKQLHCFSPAKPQLCHPRRSVAKFSLGRTNRIIFTDTLVSDKIQLPEGQRDIYMFCHDHFSEYSVMITHFEVKMRLKPLTKDLIILISVKPQKILVDRFTLCRSAKDNSDCWDT